MSLTAQRGQPIFAANTQQNQFAAHSAPRMKTGSSIKPRDIILLLLAFGFIIGGYMIIRQQDRRRNIVRIAAKTSTPGSTRNKCLGVGNQNTTTLGVGNQNTTTLLPAKKARRRGHFVRFYSKVGGPMGRRPLLCTVGASDLQQDSMVPEDGLCDYLIFTHYYHSTGDTFADDDSSKTRTFLEHAARSSRTAFGLSVTYRNVAAAKRDIAGQHGQSKLRHYWTEKRVYHYGILDAEYYGFPGNTTRQLQLTFDLLRGFRRIQKRIKRHDDTTNDKPRGFTLLGVTPWVRGDKDVFSELSEHLNSFRVDGLILRTHLFENEIASKFPNCRLTPPTSYGKSKSDYLMGMADVLRLYKRHKGTSWRHSLMLSFTMALRWYAIDNGRLDIGAPCDKTARLAVRVTDATHACEELPDYFASAIADNHSQSMIAHGEDGGFATYDDARTIIHKMCTVSVNFPNVEAGVALFDTDFQDWKRSCTRNSQAALRGSVRLQDVRAHYRKTASTSPQSSSNCPHFSTGSI